MYRPKKLLSNKQTTKSVNRSIETKLMYFFYLVYRSFRLGGKWFQKIRESHDATEAANKQEKALSNYSQNFSLHFVKVFTVELVFELKLTPLKSRGLVLNFSSARSGPPNCTNRFLNALSDYKKTNKPQNQSTIRSKLNEVFSFLIYRCK